jgi:hypothetical protein
MITFYEYDADWSIKENCFLTTFKGHFQNSKRLIDHEGTHKKECTRKKILLSPFWSHIKVNPPEQSDSKFYEYLNVNNHPRLLSQVYLCLAPIADKFYKFLNATKTGSEH